MKMILSIFLCVIMVMTSGILVFAESDDPNFVNGDNGILYGADDVTIIDGSNWTDEGIVLLDLTQAKRTLNVPVCKQETGYYCGPATVKQTLTCINNTAPSQSAIASAIGTTTAGSDLASMVSYINKKIPTDEEKEEYVIVKKPSKSYIQSMVNNGVTWKHPVICRLKFSKGGSWKYSTDGHFMNANGYDNYGNKIYVTDPNIQRVDKNASGSYYVSIDELYNATVNHFAQQMAY